MKGQDLVNCIVIMVACCVPTLLMYLNSSIMIREEGKETKLLHMVT
jgi:hypothetical protein